jgi:GntR family transcriptional regulator/MocR family aminotransferase
MPELSNRDAKRRTRPSNAPLLGLALEKGPQAVPLYRQLYEQLRDAVLDGRLEPGHRLPATRVLASELACSRNTVVGAFEQLLAEGYLEGQVGAGTFVSRVLPDDLLSTRRAAEAQSSVQVAPPPRLSQRGQALSTIAPPRLNVRAAKLSRAFAPGIPETGYFPFELWGRMLGRLWRNPTQSLLRYGDPAGYYPLRVAIASYLRAVRALRVQPDQVFITSGSQQAFDLALRILADPGDKIWLETPGYHGLTGPVVATGVSKVPLPVDSEGLSVEQGRQRAPEARLAVVSPSHQYPLGVVMSLARRLELLDWAREADAWILEDDYDSEFRYSGRPLAALQSLDPDRVVYLGSFSKVLFPSLRIAYLVVPPGLVETFTAARAVIDDHPAITVQPILADFISQGHFAAHVRRMRTLYAARQEALIGHARQHLVGLLDIQPHEAGMHLVAGLTDRTRRLGSDQQIAALTRNGGLITPPLGSYSLDGPARPADRQARAARLQGLVLGYACLTEEEIKTAVIQLAKVLAQPPAGEPAGAVTGG